MEKNTSKKLLAGIFALSAVCVLASCDPIEAVPVNYENPIVLNNQDKKVELDENQMGKIYDQIAGDRNTRVVSDILDEVAYGKFGYFHEIVKAASDDAARLAYIDAHKEVFVRADDDKIEDPANPGTMLDAKVVQKDRFDEFVKDIKNRISEVFYGEITSGSYNDDEGRFDESKLFMAHYFEFYDVKAPASDNIFFVTNELTKENAVDFLKGVYDVSEERLAWEAQTAEEKAKNPFKLRGYIEESIFPQILKDKLVEEYIGNTNYGALGRSYAREVNYLKVTYESDVIPRRLLKNFATDYIEKEGVKLDFEIVAKAIKGFEKVDTDGSIVPLETESDAQKLLEKTLPETDVVVVGNSAHYQYKGLTLIPAGTYFKNTKIGELIESYEKAIKAEDDRFPTSTNKAELDKFLASGKTKEYGLREKLVALGKEDYTTDGWYVKNGGLSDLPAALRDRLFNINVANSLDDGSLKYEDASVTEVTEVGGVKHYPLGSYETDAEGNTLKRLPYLRNVDGKKLVIPAKSQSFADDHFNYIYQDVDGKALYIIQVLEAPSTPKLNKDSATSYAKLAETKGDAFKTEHVARAVAKVLGTKDSYVKDAYTKYLEKYEFLFYETTLEEYFKGEYPDLFDDED